MMKHLILIVVTLCSFSVFGQSNLTGTWDTGEDNTIIEITEKKVPHVYINKTHLRSIA